MKHFPQLNKNQVALLFSEAATGHVLDTNLNLVINGEQEVYLVFDSFEESMKKAVEILNMKRGLECVIYDSAQIVLKYIESK